MAQFADESSVEMPVVEDEATVLKNLNIQKITAQMIVELEKDFNNRSLGENNVANLYYDYRMGLKSGKGSDLVHEPSQYLVGPRDVLSIMVWDHPELINPAGGSAAAIAAAAGGNNNSPTGVTGGATASALTTGSVTSVANSPVAGHVVGENGTFFYPYVGLIKASGKTVDEIREELVTKLAKYIENVQLDVRVASYRSQRVYVVGEVNLPGIQVVKDIPLTVLEAINNAGGVQSDADLRNIKLTRNGKTYTINLLALYEGGDIRQNIVLQHGDVLNVNDNNFNKVFVLGENLVTLVAPVTAFSGSGSGRSRSVSMNKGRMTLTEAISEGGGFDQDNADAARVFVFRGGIGKPEIFLLDAKSPDALILADRFPLNPRDVVFIDRQEGQRLNQIVNQIQPTVNLINSIDSSPKIAPFR